ncbi:MAG: ABC transporter ATP-binding protein [Candidatus Berkelbacteria bacterium]|nr:ABC transporter ATP-binding protein [Candidatus Berkelbacteria bacterium]
MENVVVFEHVKKYYPLYHHITGGFKLFLFNLPKALAQMRESKYWALKDVSFEVHKGEVFGIMGSNGAGKSTILSLIAGVMRPSGGVIQVNGRVAPLLELGAGFHPDLTGRENALLNGILLGLTKKEIASRLNSVLEFAELGQFIDQPVRTYSSGMLARLGFSVAVNTDPELLLVDEILAVGDENFQNKCFAKMKEFKNKGITIVIVSHNRAVMEQLCDRIIEIRDGVVATTVEQGAVDSADRQA